MTFYVDSSVLDLNRFNLVYIFNNDYIIFVSISVFIDYNRRRFLRDYADNVLLLLPELILESYLNRIGES